MISIDGKKIIKRNDIIFDVGANNGDKTDSYLQTQNIPITFLIVVFNEESRIKFVLDQAVQWADEVLVINKSSTDRTKEICLQYGPKVNIVDIPFSIKGEGDLVSLSKLSKNDWIFISTASEIPTFNVISKAKEVLSERESQLDVVYVPRKIYSFGIHSELSPWSVSYYPFLYHKHRAIVSNTIHKNLSARDEAFTYRIPFSDDCCVYHFTHTTAKQYILDMLDYFQVEAANCTDPAAMLKECFENIATYKERLESGGFALLGHACAWPIYWLGTALFIWEKQRNIDVRQLYATMREDVFRSEWGSVCEQSVALTNVTSSPVPLLWQPSWQVTSEDDLLHALKEHKICCDIRTLFVVGAHRFQEKNLFFEMFPNLTKVYLFEPLPDFYNYLVEITKNDPKIEVFPYAISDQSGQTDFYVTDNDAASSSLLHLGKHKEVFPHVNESACITVECRTIDHVISENSLNPPDMLFIDVQGAEFKVLSSLSPFLRSTVKLIYTEASTDELYVNAHVLAEIQTLLKPEFIFLGFAPLYNETPMHGNALFINRSNVHGITLHKNLPPMSVRPSNTHVPLVSAIVSTYNSEKFIRGCLQDLVDQTLFAEDKLEVIVIDSCSPENEQNIVKEFQQKYPIQIKYLRTDERESIYKAWNRGAKLASGKYITNANTDDRHRLDALEIMSRELESSPGIALVYADQLYTNIPNETFASTRATKRRIWAEYSYPTLRSHCMVSSQPMWCRDLHESYGYFDESYVSAGDWKFWLRVGKYESFKKLNQVLGLYYENPDGIENSNPLSTLESDRVKVLYGILPEEQRYSSFGYYNRDEVKVSVVIPCYNYAHYLSEAVTSVINQTFQDVEIIIVNDGSTDNTKGVAEKLIKDNPGIRISLINQPNSGKPAISRNNGIRQAKGSYILCLDADDFIQPTMLEECAALLNSFPDIAIAYTDQIYFNTSSSRTISVEEFDFHRLIQVNFMGYCSLYRKTVWEDVGGYAEDVGYEDWDFWISCGEKGYVGKRISKPLFCYRQHGSGQYKKDTEKDLEIRAKIYQRHPNLYGSKLCQASKEYLPRVSVATTEAHCKDFRVVAIISAHNEGDVIYHVIGDLVGQGVDVYLINHCSTDNTVAEAEKWLGKGLIHIENFPQDAGYHLLNEKQYIWYEILRRKEELAAKLEADWFIHADADEFRESPWAGYSLRTAIQAVDRLGVNAIDFALLNFRPVDNSFVPGSDVRNALRYFEWGEDFNALQIKCWKNMGVPVDLKNSGGHSVAFEGRKVFPVKFLLRHYPIRSQLHGERKVFEERKQRFSDVERSVGWHVQYNDVRDRNHNFLRDPVELILYDHQMVRQVIAGTETLSNQKVDGTISPPRPNANQPATASSYAAPPDFVQQDVSVRYPLIPLVGHSSSSILQKLSSSERTKDILKRYTTED